MSLDWKDEYNISLREKNKLYHSMQYNSIFIKHVQVIVYRHREAY